MEEIRKAFAEGIQEGEDRIVEAITNKEITFDDAIVLLEELAKSDMKVNDVIIDLYGGLIEEYYDEDKKIQYALDRIEEGYVPDYKMLAQHYFGLHTKQDNEQGSKMLEEGIKHNQEGCDVLLASYLYWSHTLTREEEREKVEFIQERADKKDPNACDQLAQIIYYGYERSYDWDYLRKIARIAGDAGYAVSNSILGQLEFIGYNKAPNYKKARKYLERAAADFDAKACDFLGRIYFYGCEIEPNPERAFQLFNLSNLLEPNGEICLRLSMMCDLGYGIEKDDELKEMFKERGAMLLKQQFGPQYDVEDSLDRYYREAKNDFWFV